MAVASVEYPNPREPRPMTPVLATVGHGATAFGYLTRATGLVALVLLSMAVVLGILCSVGWVSDRWPRFVSQSVHRDVSLLCLVLIVIHVVTTVADGYVPIGLFDAVIPFRSPYRTVWVGLGACAFDVFLAVAVTSGVRRRIGAKAWRTVHWAAYACWPIALFHSLGSGSDARLPVAQFVYLVCVVSVIAALGWRVATANAATPTWRVAGAVGGCLVLLGAAVFALAGPMQPGWSRRAGTASALLASLSPSTTTVPTASVPSAGPTPQSPPPTPFTSAVDGSYVVEGPDGSGNETVVISLRLRQDHLALTVTLAGTVVGSGVAMTSGEATLGDLRGPVTSLDGGTVAASVRGNGTADDLSMHLNLDRANHLVSGSLSGVAA
jgi:sulfoxide reductase heme-binding subunit YedZ